LAEHGAVTFVPQIPGGGCSVCRGQFVGRHSLPGAVTPADIKVISTADTLSLKTFLLSLLFTVGFGDGPVAERLRGGTTQGPHILVQIQAGPPPYSQEGAPLAEPSRFKTMTTDVECKAARKAEHILSSLTLSTPPHGGNHACIPGGREPRDGGQR
jgi:hypothetical protein